MLLSLACLKCIFLKFYKYWLSLCDIIRVKRSASCCPGQNDDICPSIKKSMIYLKSNIVRFEKDKLGFIKSRSAYSVHNIKHFPKFLYHQDFQICFVKRNLRYVKPCSKVNLRSLASIKCNCGRMLGRYKTTSKPWHTVYI